MNNKKNFSPLVLLRAVLIGLGAFLVLFSLIPLTLSLLNIGMLAGFLIGSIFLALGLFWEQAVRLWKKIRGGKFRVFATVLLCIFLAGLTVYASSVGLVISGMYAPEEDCETVLVLGCLVRGNTPSLLLRYRIDAAADYLQRHPDSVCVVSGGQGYRENITEAACMKRELMALGIAEERIFEEDRSTNTGENVRFSKEVMEREGLSTRVSIVTNDFHVFRGRMVAQKAGLEAYGIAAKSRISSRVCYTLREGIGLVFYLLFER